MNVDFELRGCPINKNQLLEVINAFLNERKPNVSPNSVCIECKKRGTVCIMRDATRGGLCAVLNELAKGSSLQFDVVEREIPVSEGVRGACEVLGLDALQVACEGRFVAIVAKKDEERALDILKTRNETAAVIGRVTDGQGGLVTIQTPIGGRRILDMPTGELLPRIC